MLYACGFAAVFYSQIPVSSERNKPAGLAIRERMCFNKRNNRWAEAPSAMPQARGETEEEKQMQPGEKHNLFTDFSQVRSRRILYTASPFARANLLHLQEAGSLTALAPHTSRRDKLRSCLCFAVLDGSGTLTYEGQEYPLEAGDVVFVDCRRPYAHSTGGDGKKLWSLQWCHFYGPYLAAVYDKYCERGGQPVIHPEDVQPFVRIMQETYEAATSEDYIRDMWINAKLNLLLTYLMGESWRPEAQCDGETGNKKRDVQQVKSYLEEHHTEKLTLETVADLFFINKHYLARLFKERYGISVNGYLQQVRITHAKQMLRFTDKKVESVGLECGIGELSYFSRIFKKVEGVSPSEYRSMWRP